MTAVESVYESQESLMKAAKELRLATAILRRSWEMLAQATDLTEKALNDIKPTLKNSDKKTYHIKYLLEVQLKTCDRLLREMPAPGVLEELRAQSAMIPASADEVIGLMKQLSH